jgi:hypothetical protein
MFRPYRSASVLRSTEFRLGHQIADRHSSRLLFLELVSMKKHRLPQRLWLISIGHHRAPTFFAAVFYL